MNGEVNAGALALAFGRRRGGVSVALASSISPGRNGRAAPRPHRPPIVWTCAWRPPRKAGRCSMPPEVGSGITTFGAAAKVLSFLLRPSTDLVPGCSEDGHHASAAGSGVALQARSGAGCAARPGGPVGRRDVMSIVDGGRRPRRGIVRATSS